MRIEERRQAQLPLVFFFVAIFCWYFHAFLLAHHCRLKRWKREHIIILNLIRFERLLCEISIVVQDKYKFDVRKESFKRYIFTEHYFNFLKRVIDSSTVKNATLSIKYKKEASHKTRCRTYNLNTMRYNSIKNNNRKHKSILPWICIYHLIE